MKKFLIILGILLLGGCALRTSHVTYPILRPIEGLSIVEKGNNFQSCFLKQKRISVSYKIVKESFTLYVKLGNQYIPEVYLGAKDKKDNILNIKMNNLSHDDFFYNLSKSEHLPSKEKITKYGLSKSYSKRILFNENSQKRIINSFGPINLEIYDLKGQKIDNLKLEFDLESFDCKGIETI